MYLEYDTREEAIERANASLTYIKARFFHYDIHRTNSDTYVWKTTGILTPSELLVAVDSYEPKQWEDEI
jgi:hypothetical protein